MYDYYYIVIDKKSGRVVFKTQPIHADDHSNMFAHNYNNTELRSVLLKSFPVTKYEISVRAVDERTVAILKKEV